MAKIQAYKFVNPGVAASATPKVHAAAKHTLAVNRIGSTVEGIANVIVDIQSINKATLVFQKKVEITKRINLRRERDAEAEARQENANLKSPSQSKKKADKDKKKLKVDKPKDNPFLDWAEKTFAPLKDFFIAIVGVSIIKKYHEISQDPQKKKEWEDFTFKFKFVVGKIYNFVSGTFQSIYDSWQKLFGKDKEFGERLEGLGDLVKGIAGLLTIGFFLNPMALVNVVLTGIDWLLGGGGADVDTPNKKPDPKAKTTPDAPDAKPKGYYDDAVETSQRNAQRAADAKPKKGILGGFMDWTSSQWNKLKNKAQTAWGLADEWAQKQYANLSESVRKQWEKLATLSKKLRARSIEIGSKIKNKVGDAQKFMSDGVSSLGAKLKNFATDKILAPLGNLFKPVVDQLKGMANKVLGPMFETPIGKKVLEALKKKGINGAGDFAGIAKRVGGKALPIVGGLVNLLFAYDRFKGGDPFGGLLESLSAGFDIAGLIPGGQFGPPISMGIDAYMFARDLVPGIQEFEEKMINKIPGAKKVGNMMKDLGKKLPDLGSIVGMLTGNKTGDPPVVPQRAAGGKVALYAGHADMDKSDPSGAFGTSGGGISGTRSTAPQQSYAKGYLSNEAYFNDKIAQKAAAKSGGIAMYRKPVRTRSGSDPNSNWSRIDKDNAAGITTIEIHQDAPKPMGMPGMMGINPDMRARGNNNGFLKALNSAYGIHNTQKGLGSVNRNNLSTLLEVAPLGWNVLKSPDSFIERESSKIANALKAGAKGKVPEVTGDPNAGDASNEDYTGDDSSVDSSYDGASDSPPPPPPPDPMSALKNLQSGLFSAFGMEGETSAASKAEESIKGFNINADLGVVDKKTIGNYDFSKVFAMNQDDANMIPIPIAFSMAKPIIVTQPINTSGQEVVSVRRSPFLDK